MVVDRHSALKKSTMPPAKIGKVRTSHNKKTHFTNVQQASRTHEENQERAYVAASRRSDRSLEARVESARRASKIHKRRTGRALRVTERDVSNEEMYEEEEEDFSVQYRKLAVHLQTGSIDFNKRLENYLGTQIAIRTAMVNANGNMHPQQHHPNAYAQVNNSPMVQSPMGMNQVHMLQMQMQQQNSQSMYSQGPYPQQWPQNIPSRSQPTPPTQLDSPVLHGNNVRSQSMTPSSFSPFIHTPQTFNQSYPQYGADNVGQTGESNNYSPFGTALPANAQQLLGNTLDPNHPYTAQLMSGSHQSQTRGFHNSAQVFPPMPKESSTTFHQSQGLHATLGRSSSNMEVESLGNPDPVNNAQSPEHDQMVQHPFEPFAAESEFTNFDDYVDIDNNYPDYEG